MDQNSYNSGMIASDFSAALRHRKLVAQIDELQVALNDERYMANSLENLAANRTRKIKAWDDIIWEIVKRVQSFDPETRYRILGVCKDQDASPAETLTELRKVQEAWFQKIKKAAPEDNSDTDVPAVRAKIKSER